MSSCSLCAGSGAANMRRMAGMRRVEMSTVASPAGFVLRAVRNLSTVGDTQMRITSAKVCVHSSEPVVTRGER